MSTYSATQAEQVSGELAHEKLAAVVSAIEQDGFAVVDGLVSPETCELLANSVCADAEQVRSLETLTPHEKVTGQGHLQLGLRRGAPYVREDLVANPLVEQVVAGVLGADAWLGFYNGNVNMPGSVHQPLHYDRPFSWRTKDAAAADGQSWPPPTTTLACSIALTEINIDNGATEIYPGTHHETAVTQWPLGERLSNHPELVKQWGPPARMPIPAGGICFRDPRMWHRGVPNPSDQTRPMVALTYHAGRCKSWRGRLVKNLSDELTERFSEDATLRLTDEGELKDGRLVFEESARDVFEITPSRHGVNRNARFVASPQKVNHFLDAHLLGGARVVSTGTIGPAE